MNYPRKGGSKTLKIENSEINVDIRLLNPETSTLICYIFIPAKEHFNKRPLLCKLYKDFYIKIFI
jgi:hypothetical protein